MTSEKFFRKELVKELRKIEVFMRKEENFERKLFFYSAAYGITNRTLRYTFSRDILLADLILTGTYTMLMETTGRIKGGDPNVKFEEIHFERLCDGIKLLADRFEKGENIQEPLEILTTTVFSLTGPGSYMREKGDLKL